VVNANSSSSARLDRVANRDAGKADAATVRFQNERLLLNHIWCCREISRADLSRATGLSRSTVSDIVNTLLETGLVRFLRAGSSSGGRRPILLGFDDEAWPLVGVDLGASHISVAVTSLRCELRAWRHQRHDVRNDPRGTLEHAREMVFSALAEAGWEPRHAVGIGVAVPAPVDPARPEAMSPVVLPAWSGIDLPGEFGEAFGRPVFVDNDANLGALAELWWGAGADGRDLAFIKLGTGVGAGLLHQGAIYRGASGIAGEIGHLVVDPGGRECMCGLRGCLATVASSAALKELVIEALTSGRESVLTEDLDTQALVEAAKAGDAVAIEVISTAGRTLGTAIASLVNLVNPATVVLGGGLSRAGDILFGPLRNAMKRRALLQSLDEVRLVASTLEDREIALGAATLVLEAALDNQTLFPAVERPQKAKRA